MAMTVEARHKLHQRLEQVLGVEEATTFMEHMPPVGWADVATKRDLDAHAVLTKRDLDRLGSELRGDLSHLESELRGDLGHLESGLRGDLSHLGSELRSEMRVMDANLRTALADGLRVQTFAILGGGSVLVGLGTVLSRLLA